MNEALQVGEVKFTCWLTCKLHGRLVGCVIANARLYVILDSEGELS